MSRVLELACKDLRQILRDWKSGLFLLVMPVIFTLFFGFVMGPALNPAQPADPRLPVGVLDRDGGSLAASLGQLLAGSAAVRPVALEEPSDPAQEVDGGDVVAALIVPAGYSGWLLAGEPVSLDVIVDTGQPAGQTALNVLETVSARLVGAVQAARISLAAAEAQQPFSDDAARLRFLEDSLAAAVTAWGEPPLSVQAMSAAGAGGQETASNREISGFAQSSPGMMVQFAVFGLITSAMVLVLERKSGTLQRLLTTPMRPAGVIGGHILAMFLVVFVQQAILVLLGQFAFGVNYFRQPLAILLLVTVLSLWAASLGLLISVLARKEDQVITLSLVAMFIFAALGGAWFPLEVAGKTFAAVGHLMPTAWAMDGFQNIVLRGLGFQSVLAPAAILAGYTLIFFVLAIWRFRFE